MESQEIISGRAGISQSYFSAIINGKKRPTWETAKKLAGATGTPPILWLEGTPDEIKTALDDAYPDGKPGQAAA